MSTQKERAAILKMAAVDHLIKYRASCNLELGVVPWGKRKADVVGMTMKGELTIVEVKSCQSDFLSDKKWQHYLPFCHKFYFCFGHDHWAKCKNKILESIKGTTAGVLVLKETGYCYVAKRCGRNPITDSDHFAIILRMAYRGGQFKRIKNRRQRRYL